MLQSQELADQQNRWMDHMTFATALRDAVGGAKVIQALYETSQKEWNNCFDANDPDSHLIKGVFTSLQKSDAVRVYISKLVAQYMKSIGTRVTAWTKGTIASENFTNVAITNRISATQFETNYDLFKIVATRLLGFDDMLVDFAIVDGVKGKARTLTGYLGLRFDVAETYEDVLFKYPDAVTYFEDLLESTHEAALIPAFTANWFDQLFLNIATYSHEEVKPDLFDMLPVFVFHHYSCEMAVEEANVPTMITMIQNLGYETITCKLQNGQTIRVKSSDGEITTLPNREERHARYALEAVLGQPCDKDVDVLKVLAEVRAAYLGTETTKPSPYQPGEALREKVRLSDYAGIEEPHSDPAVDQPKDGSHYAG